MESSNLPESLDIDKLRQWIGREQESQDIITPRLIAQWNACFDDPGASVDTASKARSFPGLHWAIAPDTAPLASLDWPALALPIMVRREGRSTPGGPTLGRREPGSVRQAVAPSFSRTATRTASLVPLRSSLT